MPTIVIKVGHVSPQTGPLAGFAEADPYILGEIEKVFAGGIENNGKLVKVEIIAKDSQSNPNRAAEVAAELILKDEVDIITAAATPDTTNPVADQAEVNERALHHHRLPVAALFLRPQRRARHRLRLDLSFLLGPRRRHRRVPGAVGPAAARRRAVGGLFPNDADGNAWGDADVGFPPALREGRLQARRSRPLPAAQRRLHRPDRGLQGGRLRDRHRQHDPAGLRHLLGAGGPAGPQAEDRHHRQGAALPLGDRVARRRAATASPPRSGGRRTIPFKSTLTGAAAKELADAYTERDQAAVDAADRLQARAVRGGRRRRQARPPTSTTRRHRRGDRATEPADHRRAGRRGRDAGEERHQDAARRRPVAEEGDQFRAGHLPEQDRAGDSGRRPARA